MNPDERLLFRLVKYWKSATQNKMSARGMEGREWGKNLPIVWRSSTCSAGFARRRAARMWCDATWEVRLRMI